MTEALDTATTALISALNDISDAVERYEAAEALKARIDLEVKSVKAEVAKSLYDGRSWAAVGKLLGVTGSRAEQISRGSR
jgi:ABC-type hemin transport system substrate-binding protein